MRLWKFLCLGTSRNPFAWLWSGIKVSSNALDATLLINVIEEKDWIRISSKVHHKSGRFVRFYHNGVYACTVNPRAAVLIKETPETAVTWPQWLYPVLRCRACWQHGAAARKAWRRQPVFVQHHSGRAGGDGDPGNNSDLRRETQSGQNMFRWNSFFCLYY